MACFTGPAREMLVALGVSNETLDGIDGNYDLLAGQEVEVIQLQKPNQISPRQLALNNLAVLRQGILHRSQSLTKAIGDLILGGQVHAIALCARGQLESTAQLGYFCRKLQSHEAGTVVLEDLAKGLGEALMAANHPFFEEAPKPINVLTYFDKADLHLAPLLPKGKAIPRLLRDQYDWLSDYCHPNFLSSGSSATFDTKSEKVVFQHHKPLRDSDANLVTNLAISIGSFVLLWADMDKRQKLLEEEK